MKRPEAPFVQFPKIARLNREIIVTEKLDGTNGVVYVDEEGGVFAGSRTRWITPEEDNFGFARWVEEHKDELAVGLGIGTHYGEWWGPGIQRRYSVPDKRFSLFNVHLWADGGARPSCCHVVPTLYRGPFSQEAFASCLDALSRAGSVASPGFMRPEGVVMFHTASQTLYKVTIEKDEDPKGEGGTS